MKACVFPGQGAQAIGMGKDVFERQRALTDAASDVLGYSIEDLCTCGPVERLNDTRYTQPALYVVNALTYLTRREDGMSMPDYVLGHSLGEYDALFAAGVIDFETGLKLVRRRGELMSEASGGGMVAILGCDRHTARAVLDERGLRGIDIANDNGPTQVVLSGPKDDLAAASKAFTDRGAAAIPLRTSAAFHSRYMEPVVSSFAKALAGVTFSPSIVPVIANVSALPYEGQDPRDSLCRQLREPVRWAESVRYLLDRGVDVFEECGPGQVLTGMIKDIRRHCERLPRATVSIPAPKRPGMLTAEQLGNVSFRNDYGVRRAFVAASMRSGISSAQLVVRMARAGYLAYLSTDGLTALQTEKEIDSIQEQLGGTKSFGVNLVAESLTEMATVELLLRRGVRCVEGTLYVSPSIALVLYRLKGFTRGSSGQVEPHNKLMVKVSRPDVAETFMRSAPARLVERLVTEGRISAEQAELARAIPIVDDLFVEADAGGSAALLQSVLRRRDETGANVRVGIVDDIGTPEGAAAAFLLGADFIVSGVINQCTPEAGTSERVKDLLESASVQDVAYAPDGELFELGSSVRVLTRGISFAARASRLYELWKRFDAWEDIDPATRTRIERDYFGCSFAEASLDATRDVPRAAAGARTRARAKDEMALVFRWYCRHANELALRGTRGQEANYQVRCEPALGAFNQYVRGTPLEKWRSRHVDAIADMIMDKAASTLQQRLLQLAGQGAVPV